MLYTNSDNSLKSKSDELKSEVTINEPDIICITEVKPKNGDPTEEQILELDGYHLFVNHAYKDDDTRGVCLYIKEYLNSSLVTTDRANQFKDSLWVEVCGNNSELLLIGLIYRSGTPAKAIALDNSLHQVIKEFSAINKYSEILILGDFNHPNIKWKKMEDDEGSHIIPQETTSSVDAEFIKCLDDSLLSNHVTKPTRYRIKKVDKSEEPKPEQKPSICDLVLTKNSDAIDEIGYRGHLGYSDHIQLMFDLNFFIPIYQEVKKT